MFDNSLPTVLERFDLLTSSVPASLWLTGERGQRYTYLLS